MRKYAHFKYLMYLTHQTGFQTVLKTINYVAVYSAVKIYSTVYWTARYANYYHTSVVNEIP